MAARPASRRISTLTAPANPLVRNFSRPTAGFTIEWDVRTAYDFVFSLSEDAGIADDLPPKDRRWLTDAKAELRAAAGDALDVYGADFCVVLAGLAVDHPEVTNARAFVKLLTETDDGTIIRTVLGDDLRNPETKTLAEQALQGDGKAVEELVARTVDHSLQKRERLLAIYRDPAAIIGPAKTVLGSWLESFEVIEDRVATLIQRDYELRAEDRANLGQLELIERTTGGIRWLSEPGVRRLILAPSYFARPYNFLLGGDDWRMFGYPISDAALDTADPLAPPPSVVRLHRALGDGTRLRILRLLRDRDLYLTEIAQQLELSKPTIKHHLALLRAAGLVTITEEGGLSYYSLRRARLDDASTDLKRFLVDQ
jgi:DNA-binding transcriptional ArsR family regulator